MAISVDATSNTVNVINQTAGGTTTVSHTCTSATIIVVSISTWNNGGTGTGCSSITWNGSALTLLTNVATSAAFHTEQWYLLSPISATGNIVATVSGKTDKLGLSGISFKQSDTVTGIDITSSLSGTTALVSQSLNTIYPGEYLVDCVSHLSANNPSANSGTQIYSDATSGTSTSSQYISTPSNGANSISWTYPDPGDAWAYSVLAILALPPPSPPGGVGRHITVGNGMSRSEIAN